MKSTNFGYIPALDHLRGFAAVVVLFFHSSHFISHKLIYATPYDPANWARTENPFSALMIEGHTAVSLFFLLSGFVFTVGSLGKKLIYTTLLILPLASIAYYCIERPFLLRRRTYTHLMDKNTTRAQNIR